MNNMIRLLLLWHVLTLTAAAQEPVGNELNSAEAGKTATDENLPGVPARIQDLFDSRIDPDVLRKEIERLRKEYQSFDQKARSLAELLRSSPDETKKAELHSLVLSAFLSRQKLLQSELMEMQQSLIQTQASLRNRERISNQIIDRRVENLLNPELDWDEATPSNELISAHEQKPLPPTGSGVTDWEKKEKVLVKFQPSHNEQVSVGDKVDVESAYYDRAGRVVSEMLLEGLHVDGTIKDVEAKQADLIQLRCNPLQAYMLEALMKQAPESLKLVKADSDQTTLLYANGINDTACTAYVMNAHSKWAMLAQLQGTWELVDLSDSEFGPMEPETSIEVSIEVSIEGTVMRMFYTGDGQRQLGSVSQLKFGEDGPPQQFDMIYLPNDGDDREIRQGIMEIRDGVVRVCAGDSPRSPRPEVFVAGSDVSLWELRRPVETNDGEDDHQVSELEGDWHWYFDSMSTIGGVRSDVTVRGQTWSNVVAGKSTDMPVEIDVETKTIVFTGDGETSYFYTLKDDELVLRNEEHVLKLKRGHLGDRKSAVSELEGDWHQVPFFDQFGRSESVSPHNRKFRKDRSLSVWPGQSHECRIQVNPDEKTIWSFSKDEDGSFTMESYELKDDQLILKNSSQSRVTVLERGLVPMPSVIPEATKEQKSLWRSAVVQIEVSGQLEGDSDGPIKPKRIGFGIVIREDGTMVSHLAAAASDFDKWPNIVARFDDGSNVALEFIKSSQGLVMLRPKEKVNLNHYFPLASTATGIGDEVYVGVLGETDQTALLAPAYSSGSSNVLVMSAMETTLLKNDRRVVTLEIPVWQLKDYRGRSGSSGSCKPVLSKDGELLALTMANTGGLLLAIPVKELRAAFAGSLNEPAGKKAGQVNAESS